MLGDYRAVETAFATVKNYVLSTNIKVLGDYRAVRNAFATVKNDVLSTNSTVFGDEYIPYRQK